MYVPLGSSGISLMYILEYCFKNYSKFIGSTLNHYLAKILFHKYYSKKDIPVGQMTPGIIFFNPPPMRLGGWALVPLQGAAAERCAAAVRLEAAAGRGCRVRLGACRAAARRRCCVQLSLVSCACFFGPMRCFQERCDTRAKKLRQLERNDSNAIWGLPGVIFNW